MLQKASQRSAITAYASEQREAGASANKREAEVVPIARQSTNVAPRRKAAANCFSRMLSQRKLIKYIK